MCSNLKELPVQALRKPLDILYENEKTINTELEVELWEAVRY